MPSMTSKTRRYVRHEGKLIPAARAAWCDHYGSLPEGSVYFKDGDTENLDVSNMTLDPSDRITGHMRTAVCRIAATPCIKVNNQVREKASGALVFSDYRKLKAFGMIDGFFPIIALWKPKPEKLAMIKVQIPVALEKHLRDYAAALVRLHHDRVQDRR